MLSVSLCSLGSSQCYSSAVGTVSPEDLSARVHMQIKRNCNYVLVEMEIIMLRCNIVVELMTGYIY